MDNTNTLNIICFISHIFIQTEIKSFLFLKNTLQFLPTGYCSRWTVIVTGVHWQGTQNTSQVPEDPIKRILKLTAKYVTIKHKNLES